MNNATNKFLDNKNPSGIFQATVKLVAGAYPTPIGYTMPGPNGDFKCFTSFPGPVFFFFLSHHRVSRDVSPGRFSPEKNDDFSWDFRGFLVVFDRVFNDHCPKKTPPKWMDGLRQSSQGV